jgi:integrase
LQAKNLTNKAKLVWQVILWLSRYGGLRTPSETLSLRWEDIDWELNRLSIPEPKVEHHEGRGIRSCPIFPELRPILDEAFDIFGDKSEYVVAAPQYRAAANTAMGWKNSNLRTEMTRLLRRAGVSGWPRLFRVSRGGGWYGGAASCRSAYRFRFIPSDRDSDYDDCYGFRVALSSTSGIPK